MEILLIGIPIGALVGWMIGKPKGRAGEGAVACLLGRTPRLNVRRSMVRFPTHRVDEIERANQAAQANGKVIVPALLCDRQQNGVIQLR